MALSLNPQPREGAEIEGNRRKMDETKLTKKDKEEIEESGRELILGTIQKIMEMLEELKEEIEKA